jgi:cell division topological specificity factor
VLEDLKEDMFNVISTYMEIDRAGTEVTLNQDDTTVALVANIPIIKINRTSPKDNH